MFLQKLPFFCGLCLNPFQTLFLTVVKGSWQPDAVWVLLRHHDICTEDKNWENTEWLWACKWWYQHSSRWTNVNQSEHGFLLSLKLTVAIVHCFNVLFQTEYHLLFLGSTGNIRLEVQNRIKMEILYLHAWYVKDLNLYEQQYEEFSCSHQNPNLPKPLLDRQH